jgi:hypothetical protein
MSILRDRADRYIVGARLTMAHQGSTGGCPYYAEAASCVFRYAIWLPGDGGLRLLTNGWSGFRRR